MLHSNRLGPIAVALVLVVAERAAAQPRTIDGFLVSGYASAAVHAYSATDGTPLGTLGTGTAVNGAQSLTHGPDGKLYVAAEELDSILRFDGASGAFLDAFVADDPGTPQDESGGIQKPTSAIFGPDGHLYVGSFDGDDVRRFDGASGAFLDVFVAAGSGGLNGPDCGMTFGPDGHLYVPSFNSNRVLRYDGASGAFLDVFVTPAEGNLSRPRMLRFRSDGTLFVSSWGNGRILRYDLAGVFKGVFASGIPTPTGFAFDPDSGDMLVTSDNASTVRVLDDLTGAQLPILVAAGGGGLVGGTFLEFFPDRELRLARPPSFVAGEEATLAISGATPGGTVYLLLGTASEAQLALPCGHDWIAVADPRVIPFSADARGKASASGRVPPHVAGATFYVQAFEASSCRASSLLVLDA
jgi:outer membrane protein assembly factor BamB